MLFRSKVRLAGVEPAPPFKLDRTDHGRAKQNSSTNASKVIGEKSGPNLGTPVVSATICIWPLSETRQFLRNKSRAMDGSRQPARDAESIKALSIMLALCSDLLLASSLCAASNSAAKGLTGGSAAIGAGGATLCATGTGGVPACNPCWPAPAKDESISC